MPPRSTTKTLSVVGRFRDQITGPVRKSFKNVRAAARTGIESFRKFARSTSGVALALAGVASAAAAVTKAVKTTSDTIDQLARVSNTSRNFAEDINEIRTATAQLAVDTGSKIEEVRRAFQAVGRQYRETADAIAITTEAVRLGVATSTDQEAAAKSLTVAMKAFQLQSKDAGGAAALLSQAVQTTGGRLEELDRSIGKIGPTITKAGVSFNETVAVLVAMGEAGIRGGEALEGTRTLLGKIVSPTEKAKEELRALGVEIEFGSLEGGKFRERLIQMRKAIDENSDAARILGLTGQSLNQFLLLSQNNAAGFGTALENLGSSAETFVETFDRSNTTISSNFQAMKNLALVGIEGAMLPAMKELNEAIGSQSGNVRAIQLRWSSYSAEVIARLKLTWETAKTIFLLMREAAISTGEHIGNAFALSSEIASAAWLSMKATFFRALSEMAAKMKSFVDGITKGPAGSALKAILGATGLSGIAGRVDGVGNALSGALGGLSSFTGQAFSENILEARELLKLFDQEARDIGTGSAARIAALVSEYNRSIENAGFALDSANATREKAAALEKRIAGEAKKGAEAEEKRAARVKELKEQLESIGSLTNFSQERANGVAGSASGRSAADV
ncbi:MAG: phage tail tape measure protein, partial [Planctomycetota bacterium]